MKKILVYGMTNNRGGIESFIMNYYRLFDHNKIIFDFVTEYPHIAFEDEIIKTGSRIFYIPFRRRNILKHIFSLRKLINNHSEFSAIYFNILSANGAVALLGLIDKRNLIKIVHSHNNSVKRLWEHKLFRPIINILSDYKLACSKEAGTFMFGKKSLKKNQIVIIKNAINCDEFCFNKETRETVRNKYQIQNKFVIGHVGRLCYQKNTLYLIDIFNELYKICKNACLLIAGEGEDRLLVENRIKELNLQEHVLLIGMCNNVSDFMQAMDVFVLPSRYEGLPVVGVEAQAAGLPCFFSDEITREVSITKLVNFISIHKEPKFWAEKILQAKDIVRSDHTKKIIENNFDINVQSKFFEQYLENL